MDQRKFTVLVLCGTACVLASFGGLAFMYHLHAPQFVSRVPYDIPLAPGTHPLWTFAEFVGLPSLLTFAVGVVLISLGLRVGRDD